jgi:hypothetical protein
MFMIVSYPWPAASAYADLPADKSVDAGSGVDAAATLRGPGVPPVEELVRWTAPERLRLRWYRLRLSRARSADRAHPRSSG